MHTYTRAHTCTHTCCSPQGRLRDKKDTSLFACEWQREETETAVKGVRETGTGTGTEVSALWGALVECREPPGALGWGSQVTERSFPPAVRHWKQLKGWYPRWGQALGSRGGECGGWGPSMHLPGSPWGSGVDGDVQRAQEAPTAGAWHGAATEVEVTRGTGCLRIVSNHLLHEERLTRGPAAL